MFNDLAEMYEAMIDWPKRLAREGAWYRRVFAEHDVRSVVDVSCGTGRHANLFHSWNLRVEGADVSPAMIERAKARFGEPPGLRWSVRGFDAPIAMAEPFDAAICVGNSLALAPDRATVAKAVREMAAGVRGGGLLVLHLLNLWRLPDGLMHWQKCRRIATRSGIEHLVVKGVRRCGTRGFVDWIAADLTGAERSDSPDVPIQSESSPLLALEAEELRDMAESAGAAKVEVFGGYENQPYDRETSEDMIVAAVTSRQ